MIFHLNYKPQEIVEIGFSAREEFRRKTKSLFQKMNSK